ncbi:MAG: response regulator [Opitutaceae bacterium]
MNPQDVTVLIVDDSAMVRVGLKQTIDLEAGFTVVGTARNAIEALDIYQKHKPDIVVMDYRMPGQSGVDCTREILASDGAAKVVLFSAFESEEEVWRAVEAGVKGYLNKNASEGEELLEAIHEVARGRTFFPARIALKLAQRKAKPDLSERELQVLRELAKGSSNQEIVDALGVAMPTIKTHITNIRKKLGALDRTQAVVIAYKQGILHLE